MNQTVYSILSTELSAIHADLSKIVLRNPRAPIEMDMILHVALALPNLRFNQIADYCSKELGWRIAVWPGKILRMCGIEDAAERQLLSQYLVRFNQALTKLVHAEGADELSSSMASLSEIIDDRRLYALTPGLTRCALVLQKDSLCASANATERDLGLRLRELLRIMLVSQTTPIFRRLLHALASARGQRNETSINDRISGMIHDTTLISAQTISVATADEVVDSETLADENADLRAALFGLRNELVSLQEQIHTIQTTSADAATARFLADLNTSAAGHLLDNIVFSSRAIRTLENTGWIPEPIEVEGIVATITMLSDHLVRLGVEPIFDVGAQTEITMEDLTEIQYVGSEFAGPADVKLVRIKSPGWRYRDQRIARAQAVEIAPPPSQPNA